jgi:hypothetical protein
MAKGGNTGAVIFLAIIAVAGLGLSGYMFISDQFFGGDESTFPGDLRLVAIWDDLDENLTNNPLHSTSSNWLIAFDDEMYLDTNYVSTVNNTAFYLSVPGIYKINLDVILYEAEQISSTYWIYMVRNTTTQVGYFMRLEIDTTAPNPETLFHYISCSLYVNHTYTTEYYEIVASGYDDFSVATDYSSHLFNQLSIEYVIE